jgi:DNA-binding MarR family transcriptional regulator
MPGGRQRLEARELDLSLPTPMVLLSEEEREWDTAIRIWRCAWRFRRQVNRIGGSRGISFAHWNVLDATQRLIREKGDAVSQQEVVRRTWLTKGSVSALVRNLSVRGFIDVRPDCWGVSDRIWVTNGGERMIAMLRSELAESVRAFATDARLTKAL